MNEAAAYQFVLAVLLANARNDDEGLRLLAESEPKWDVATYGSVLRAAISVAYSAHVILAELTDEPLEYFIRSLALDAAAEV